VCGMWTVTSSELVLRPSSESPWSSKREIVCGVPSSVASVSRSSPPITPFSASSRPAIRGDRLGDTRDLDPGTESTGLDELLSGISVGTEEET